MKSLIKLMMKLSIIGNLRKLKGNYKRIYTLIAITFALYYFYSAGPPIFGNPSLGTYRGLFMLLILTMVFMLYPARKKSRLDQPTIVDGLLILLTILSFGYFIISFDSLVHRTGFYTTPDLLMSTIAIILSIEGARRVMGWMLPGIAILFLLYATYGNMMPTIIAHKGYSWGRVATDIFTQDAMFGIVLETTAAYVVLFVVFGGIMNAFGAGEFFVRFPYALTAGYRGGPAKAAVVASGMLGMISGSATANTVATGTFTIPLMKKTGYKPHVAGAIEPAASTGGMFMPPIMGAAVFIMAEIVNVPYAEIMIVSLVPAVLYFFSVAMISHFEAAREDMKIIPKSERENPWEVFKEGWYFFVPIVVVIYLMITGMSPSRSVFYALIILIVISYVARLIKKENNQISKTQILKNSTKDLFKGLEEGATNTLVVGSIVGAVGIILGVVFITGLGFIFTSSIMDLTFGYLPLGIFLALIISYILGMGMTVTSAYVLMAVLVAPALQEFGIAAVPAHLLVFWYSQSSNISPPVSIAAFAGASIAKADPIKTGFTALKYASFLFIIPLLFIYSPILMPEGFTIEVLHVMITAFIAVIPVAAALSKFLVKKTNLVERILLIVSGILLITPFLILSLIGLVIFVAIYILQKKQTKRLSNETV